MIMAVTNTAAIMDPPMAQPFTPPLLVGKSAREERVVEIMLLYKLGTTVIATTI